MQTRSKPTTAVVQFSRLFFRKFYQLCKVVHRQLGAHTQDVPIHHGLNHRQQILGHVKGRFLQLLCDHNQGAVVQKCVAIGLASDDMVCTNGAIASHAVFNHDRLPPKIMELGRNDTGRHIQSAASCKGHHDPNRSIGEISRKDHRTQHQGEETRQEAMVSMNHWTLPSSVDN